MAAAGGTFKSLATTLATGLATGLVASLACSCGPAHTHARAHAVLLDHEPMPPGCQALGQVRGISWNSLLYYDAPRSPALDAMRDAGAARGATHLVVHEVTPSAHALVAVGAAYRCPAWAPRDASGPP